MNKALKQAIANELEGFNTLDDRILGLIKDLPLKKKIALYKAMSNNQLILLKELLNETP